MPEIELSETCAALCWEGEDLTCGEGRSNSIGLRNTDGADPSSLLYLAIATNGPTTYRVVYGRAEKANKK